MIEEVIEKDYVKAMKDHDKERSGTLRYLKAQLKNVRIDKKADRLEDTDAFQVIKKQIKQCQESISQFKQGGREDLVSKEQAELEILKGYLPKEMSEEDLHKLIRDTIEELKASSLKDMGRVMASVIQKSSGRADNKRISELVKKSLIPS